MEKKTLLLLAFLLALFLALKSMAQKLPNRQETSLPAPAGIKIDGNATEWAGQYQAYNKGAQIFYTIANDNANLYLVIHADRSRVIEKIMEGGVSFTISTSGKLNGDKNAVVLFPCLMIGECKSILSAAGKKLSAGRVALPTDEVYNIPKNPDYVKPNKDLAEKSKVIKITGFAAIADTITGTAGPKNAYYRALPLRAHNFRYLPVANADNIQAATQFDAKGEYTYELSIPLKLLNMSAEKQDKFSYNITLNARGEDSRPGNTWYYSMIDRESLNMDLENPTDLSGTYVLTKP
ncbi:hypothetical protein HQ865_18455 [Mucilaginibacter mali]|uniref:Uncharacterized protein n=1 Tax=Mucilaginibacter mali TaxID=2740462 RepID=A0A7D4UN63_9SPHI|nr:hypothetical protein [Mucilaginibacter mali]QKJ31661.1 hypothetical protein HQ865_18455 [Mucilaginibacter mali]